MVLVYVFVYVGGNEGTLITCYTCYTCELVRRVEVVYEYTVVLRKCLRIKVIPYIPACAHTSTHTYNTVYTVYTRAQYHSAAQQHRQHNNTTTHVTCNTVAQLSTERLSN